MKTIKLSLFGIIILALGFQSCDAHFYGNAPIDEHQLPKAAQEIINIYFPGETIALVTKERDEFTLKYDVVFTNRNEIEFDKNGEWIDVSCVATYVPDGLVPPQILDHVRTLYPNVSIIEMDRDRYHYDVRLNNRQELKFNNKFQLVEIDD